VPFRKAKPPPEHPIERVYGPYRDELKVFFKKFRWGRKCTEDLVQETYLRFVIHPDLTTVRSPKRFFFWLARRVMFSESKRLSKQAQSAVSLDSLSEEVATALSHLLVEDDSSADIDREALRRNLKALPPEQLDLLELHYAQGLSVQPISEIAETNENTVKSRLKQAVQHMRNCYGDDALKQQVRKRQRRAP
jgi:RNA polymerase sigma factor (sigma-70 family)